MVRMGRSPSSTRVNKANVAARLKEIKGDKDATDEAAALNDWLKLNNQEAGLKKRLKEAEAALDGQAYALYPKLTESEIKTLVVDDKWLASLDVAIHSEMDRVSQQLTQGVKELAERYEIPTAAHARPCGRDGSQGEPPPGNDGVRMDVRLGYKQTEVGVIPEDWNARPLGSIALIAIERKGLLQRVDRAKYYGDEFLFVSPADGGFHKTHRLHGKDAIQDTGKGFSV